MQLFEWRIFIFVPRIFRFSQAELAHSYSKDGLLRVPPRLIKSR